MMQPDLPPEVREKVARELESGERIEWIGRPIPRYFSLGSTVIMLFGIPFTLFSIFWIVLASGFGGMAGPQGMGGIGSLFVLFGLPFILVGLGMLSAPYWSYRNALKTAYLVTDRRVVTIDGIWWKTVRSYFPEKLIEIVRRERSDGVGDLVLMRESYHHSNGHHRSREYGFFNIPEVKEVEGIINRLVRQATRPSRSSDS